MSGPDLLAAFCNARLDEEQHSAESMEDDMLGDGDFRWSREIAALRSIVADCEKALRYPANVPLHNLARRTLAGIASIWEDHPDYAAVSAPAPSGT